MPSPILTTIVSDVKAGDMRLPVFAFTNIIDGEALRLGEQNTEAVQVERMDWNTLSLVLTQPLKRDHAKGELVADPQTAIRKGFDETGD